MTSFITSFFKYIFGSQMEDGEVKDEDKEQFLAEQLFELELQADQTPIDNESMSLPGAPQNVGTSCFQRTGIITYMDDSSVLIDGMLFFELSATSMHLNVQDKIEYLGFNNADGKVVVVRILHNLGRSWGEEEVEENKFETIEHVIVGQVDERKGRFVHIKDSDLKFSLDDVDGTFVPIKGDWLELKCSVQFDENKPTDISTKQVLKVISFHPLRRKCTSSKITSWSGEDGVCNTEYYFNKQCIVGVCNPQVGMNVCIEAIESSQGSYEWRVIKLIIDQDNNHTLFTDVTVDTSIDKEQQSLITEKEQHIEVTYPLVFNNVDINAASVSIVINITNTSDRVHFINKWIILSKRKDSQINISPYLSRPKKLCPKETFCLIVTCQPKFLGKSKEHLIICFRGFQVERFIELNISCGKMLDASNSVPYKNQRLQTENINLQRQILKDNLRQVIPGGRVYKPPNFVTQKLGMFPIPKLVWSAVLGDFEDPSHYKEEINRIESMLPCVTEDLNINNYKDKWHTLLHIEEVQANINIRAYDIPKVFLVRIQDYLGLEIHNLSERRPSLIRGDRVIVKDTWNPGTPTYEGHIHVIKENMVLLKFNPQFHESYSGNDVAVEFQLSRTFYRRCHNAINVAAANLGPELLFPSRIASRSHQVTPCSLNAIQWYNSNLNDGQKFAVSNILVGECRPTPYCIYGPPGTGKTITVIETILQILTLIPDSRILIATPSNSASNLITERLIQYRDRFSNSLIRVIANYLINSESIPDSIKPYCATLSAGREGTLKCDLQNGMLTNCQTSFVEKCRVIIGTCLCLGGLMQMGLSRGHFTHVIVDEAGQAFEPEIMIPLSFIDKEKGQVILAGDPMQLGPTSTSKFSKELGMDESYLSRLLATFPYQKDYSAFKSGFNNKLVTKLNDSYRALEEVLELPSEMFYDATLIPKLDRSQSWVENMLGIVSDLFEMDSMTGGIFMYGIRGENLRSEDSPSWYNPQEASMVALTLCKLYKKGITPDKIGIIAPYIAQIKCIRILLDAMGLAKPKVGTVEEFQGQERPIVLISTVRSMETYLNSDRKYFLGFVNNPKRLNVALTRAQVAAILFCNPHLLCRDPYWSRIVKHAVETDRYRGCDLPYGIRKTCE